MKQIIARLLIPSVLLAGLAINIEPADASASGDIPFITIQKLKAELGEPSLVVLDVRIPKHIAASRLKIKGAVWVNPKEFDRWVHSFAKDATYVLYGDGPNEATNARVAREMKDIGFTDVNVLKGGWKAWKLVDYPVEPN